MISPLVLRGDVPPNAEPDDDPRDLSDDWPVLDRNDVDEWVRRLHGAAHELSVLGRNSNSYRTECALRMVADFLSSGSNPDEREIIVRHLTSAENHDVDSRTLRPQDLSWHYYPSLRDSYSATTGVRLRHLPTGAEVWADRWTTRAENHAEAWSRLHDAVTARVALLAAVAPAAPALQEARACRSCGTPSAVCDAIYERADALCCDACTVGDTSELHDPARAGEVEDAQTPPSAQELDRIEGLGYDRVSFRAPDGTFDATSTDLLRRATAAYLADARSDR